MLSPRILLGLTVIALGAMAAPACGPSKVEAPQATSMTGAPTTTPIQVAPAGGQFPDMSGYTEGDHDIFFSGGQRYFGIAFRTDEGLKCVSNSYRSVEDTSLRCWGPRPDKGPGVWEVETSAQTASTIRHLPDSTTTASPDPTPVLSPQHVLNYPDAHLVCGVDDQGATACRVGPHGFVLARSSTTLF